MIGYFSCLSSVRVLYIAEGPTLTLVPLSKRKLLELYSHRSLEWTVRH